MKREEKYKNTVRYHDIRQINTKQYEYCYLSDTSMNMIRKIGDGLKFFHIYLTYWQTVGVIM